MKKIFTLIIVLISFTYCYSQSQYEESVTIPPYDSLNTEMYLISSNSDWANINDTTIKYFYVLPGDYSNAGLSSNDYKIVLNTSGTQNNKRYISLYNGNNTHPGKLNNNQLAKVGFIIQNADWWVIDRMSYWERYDGFIPIKIDSSSHNIINRYFASNVAGGTVYIYPNSDNNTIQNCRVQRNDISLYLDRAAFALTNGGLDNISIKNTKILNNEVYNSVDGFQAVKTGSANQNSINYEGTIIDCNHFFIDSLIYTDCNGNQDNNGNCAYAENAIDLKSGSENPNNPFIITNNMMWGYRKADNTNSALSDPGAVIVAHFNVNNVLVDNNLIFDATRGIAVGNPVNGVAMRNSGFSNNIIYGILGYSIVIYDSDSLIFSSNLNKETGVDLTSVTFSYWWVFHNSTFIKTVQNLSVNTYDNLGVRNSSSNLLPLNNEYFNSTPGQMSDNTDSIFTTDPTINYYDLVFTTNRYTNNPLTVTIPKVLKSNPLGVASSLKEELELNVYPNPTSDFLNIDQGVNKRLKVSIYNSMGQLVGVHSLNLLSNRINISSLNRAIYYLIIETKDQIKTVKIIKQK